MALSRRNLILHALCWGIALTGTQSSNAQATTGQTDNSANKSFRTIGVRRAAPTLFYEVNGTETPLYAADSSLSQSYAVDNSGKVELYCYIPATEPELPPVKVPLAKSALPGDRNNLLLIATIAASSEQSAPRIALRAVDASLEAHPLNTIRVFNFSNRKTACKVGEEFAEIPPGGEYSFHFPEGNKVWVKIAAYEGIEEGWKMRSGGPKAIFPGTRSIIVLSDAYPSEEDPEGLHLSLRNIIDQFPPAPVEE